MSSAVNVIKGKVACITGGLGGFGYQFAKVLLKAGAKGVVLADIDDNKAPAALNKLRTYGSGNVEYINMDVKSIHNIKCGLSKALEFYGNLDYVINNAAIIDEDAIDLMVKVNYASVVYSTMLCLCKFLRKNPTDDESVVINNACIFGIDPLPPSPVYSALKHAVVGISRSFGNPYYYNRSKVKVLALCPGLTETRLSSPSKIGSKWSGLNTLTRQHVSFPANCILKLITEGENGSVWVAENQKCYPMTFQDRFQFYRL